MYSNPVKRVVDDDDTDDDGGGIRWTKYEGVDNVEYDECHMNETKTSREWNAYNNGLE